MDSYTHTIQGKGESSPEFFQVINPATEEVLASCPDCTHEQLNRAVDAARLAFPAWAATPIAERRSYLNGIADVVSANLLSLTQLLTSEQGKPLKNATEDIMAGVYWIRQISTLDIPERIVSDSAERYGITRHVPLGVVGAISPWNYPVLLAMFKIAPALLAGNTMVLKPSPFTPLTTLKIGELCRDILPAGVLNIVSGSDRLGPWITSHPGIDKISFTGSTFTGKKVMAGCAERLTRVTLELGGNDAAIVLPDVDVAGRAEDLFWAAFRNTGQVCIATKRMYVHEDVYEQVKAALVAIAGSVRVGNGADAETKLGPLNNRLQFERVKDLLADCKSQGLQFAVGGDVSSGTPGFFIPVTIVDNPPEKSRIVQEEQFGPVLPLIKFTDVDAVIALANATPYGLGSSIWTADTAKAMELSRRMQSGMVWINEAGYLSPLAAFGGHKHSGIGSEGALEGLLSYTNMQTVFIKK